MKRFTPLLAALGWTALALQLYLTMRLSAANGQGVAAGLVTWLSYFTILTNLLVALALTAALRRTRSGAARFLAGPAVNTGIAVSIAFVGITYFLLLRNIWDPQGLQLVADVLLHYVMPVLFVAWWWFVVPHDGVRWGSIAGWLLYPIAYFAYTLIRGALTGVYPYPFLDVGELGYPRALAAAGGVLVGFIVIAVLFVGITRRGRPGIVIPVCLGLILPACAPSLSAPPNLLGDFTDDYGNHFHITASEWRQLPHGRFHITRWNPARRYLIARNDSTNPSDPGLWTRIDWIPLEGMPPYTWAFCLSAYQAPSAAAAESSTVARPDTPRTGCNGHPFSRMAGRDGRDGQDGR